MAGVQGTGHSAIVRGQSEVQRDGIIHRLARVNRQYVAFTQLANFSGSEFQHLKGHGNGKKIAAHGRPQRWGSGLE